MNRVLTCTIAAAALGVVGFFLGTWLLNPAPAFESEVSEEITYVCRETGKLIRGSRDESPETDGCQELVQALYCPECRAWYPFPPPEILERMPRGPECPKHRSGLFEEIPGPELTTTP